MINNNSHFRIGFHTGAFNSAYISFIQAVEWAEKHEIHNIECGYVDGVTWNHGLGYFPHIASWQDPIMIKDFLAEKNVKLSQIDAAFPISGKDGAAIAVPYIVNTIRWAALAGCEMVDTTDGLYMPEGMSVTEAMLQMKLCYQQVMEIADRYGIVVNIETHGFFTGKPDLLDEMLNFSDSNLLKLNFDTGNVYIAGQDPVKFLQRFIHKVSHLHIKDVAPERSKESRGKEFGIGMSHCAVGDGVNADSVRQCMLMLGEFGFEGDISIECEAAGGVLMERSISWVRKTLDELGISHDIGV